MSNKTLTNVKIQLRNDTASKWTTANPVLGKGEVGIEIDTNKFKIGDGVKTWSELAYNGIVVKGSSTNGNILVDGVETKVYTLPIAGSALGGVKSSSGTGKVTVAGNGTMSVSSVATANQLATARTISLAGDVTGSASFSGAANASISATLANSGVTAGTYTKVTVDAKGRVTTGAALTAGDVPTITTAKVSGLGTAATKNVGNSSGQVPVLGSGGKLDTAVIPALAISDVNVVASESAMLALTAQRGDTAVRTDVNKTFVLKAEPASTLSNWVELLSPSSSGFVQTVNGKTGVVTLTTSDVTEGSNLYFTTSRATSNFNSNIAATPVSKLKDGASVVMKEDTLILDCGQA